MKERIKLAWVKRDVLTVRSRQWGSCYSNRKLEECSSSTISPDPGSWALSANCEAGLITRRRLSSLWSFAIPGTEPQMMCSLRSLNSPASAGSSCCSVRWDRTMSEPPLRCLLEPGRGDRFPRNGISTRVWAGGAAHQTRWVIRRPKRAGIGAQMVKLYLSCELCREIGASDFFGSLLIIWHWEIPNFTKAEFSAAVIAVYFIPCRFYRVL